MAEQPLADEKQTPTRTADAGRHRSGALDIWLGAATYWYLTALLAGLGFSLGFSFLRPGLPLETEDRDWLDAFNWMDGRWYKQIVVEGYDYGQDRNSNIAFFPVYPLLGRAVMTVTGLRAELALLIVSNLSLLGALAMLAFYVRARYPDSPTELADYTVLAAATFPTGCFFRFTYSESTFLLLALLAMYAMLRRWPLWAIALVVGLATAARPVGVALLAPFAIHIIRRASVGWADPGAPGESHHEVGGNEQEEGPTETRAVAGRKRSFGFGPTPLVVLGRFGLYLPLACWGLTAFLAYQAYTFGEPLATVRVQKNWGIRRTMSWPEKAVALATLEPVWSVYDSRSPGFWRHRDPHSIPWFSLQFATPTFFLAAIALVALGAWRRWLSLEETSLSLLLLLVPYVTRAYEMGMGSMGRFVSVVFPVYLVLGQFLIRLPGPVRAALLAVAGFFLAAYTALYAGRYVIF